MADSDTGYMHHFQIYTGKEDSQEKGLLYRVVMYLCSNMLGKNLRVYFDNFYTSAELLKDLHTQGVLACGTEIHSFHVFLIVTQHFRHNNRSLNLHS
jgi:hypothetical protein